MFHGKTQMLKASDKGKWTLPYKTKKLTFIWVVTLKVFNPQSEKVKTTLGYVTDSTENYSKSNFYFYVHPWVGFRLLLYSITKRRSKGKYCATESHCSMFNSGANCTSHKKHHGKIPLFFRLFRDLKYTAPGC